MSKYNITFNLEKEFNIEANSEKEALDKALNQLSELKIGFLGIKDFNIVNKTKEMEFMNNIRKEVSNYVKEYMESIVQQYIDVYCFKYQGKTISQIEEHLKNDYSVDMVKEDITECLREFLNDSEFKLNIHEEEYIKKEFIDRLINYLRS